MTIAVLQGTRPEIIKNYPIVKSLAKQRIPHLIFHTNQHSQSNMSEQIYRELGYTANICLNEHYSLGKAIEWAQNHFRNNNINHVIVNGDTAASVVGSLAAMYSDISVSHIEAGLRSRDNVMLEERNRIIVDAIASLLFAYTEHERKLLSCSADIRGKVIVEGNTTVDIINEFNHKLDTVPIPGDYVYVTLHRRELTQSVSRMRCIVDSLNQISNELCKVIFPIHPRTKAAIESFNLSKKLSSSIEIVEPVSFITSLQYQNHALAVLTDSGCIQEEAYMLGVPCITLRDNTERHLTIENGANNLTGFNQQMIILHVNHALKNEKTQWPEIYGKPGVGNRIVGQISDYMHN